MGSRGTVPVAIILGACATPASPEAGRITAPAIRLGNKMSDELVRQLERDAEAEAPPFGAESIEIARRLGKAASDFLLAEIRARGRTAFLALEALRSADPDAYRSLPGPEKAGIYADALKRNLFFNAWGLPVHQLTDTSRALIALGQDAVLPLRRLLDDHEPAPLSGSQDATTSTLYGNRICDYAWVFVSEILGRPYVYEMDPKERDRQIDDLRHALSSGEGTLR